MSYGYSNHNGRPTFCTQVYIISRTHEPTEYKGLGEFCKQRPQQFQGVFALDAANEWIQSLERIFRALGCGDVHKVTYASYMLTKEAENVTVLRNGTYCQIFAWARGPRPSERINVLKLEILGVSPKEEREESFSRAKSLRLILELEKRVNMKGGNGRC
ncbi:hypothetical protein Lal_00042492 [Lupinus albus]|nr:hypothetical protein Lal_00042492 [Lupinus albus]